MVLGERGKIMNYKITSYNEKDTISLAENIESEHFPNMVICLVGDLGSGKTIFTKGFAAALEVKEEVTSPTFNIIKRISIAVNFLYIIWTYIVLMEKTEDLGIEDYYDKGGVTIIEWADMIKDYFLKKD